MKLRNIGNKQTLKQLLTKYKHSIPWIKKQIYEYEPAYHSFKPRMVIVVADATFFGKRRDKLGVLVFKSSSKKPPAGDCKANILINKP